MQTPDNIMAPKRLFDLFYGTTKSWTLTTAVELDVFDITIEKKTAPEIAASLGTHETNTALFLNALCSLDLLEKENGAYINTPLSDTFLVKGKACYLGQFLILGDQWNFTSKQEMKDCIINGPKPPKLDFNDMGKLFAPYVKSMRNFSRTGVSQQLAKQISKLPAFMDMKKMLEIGGAHGMDCIAMTQKNPSLNGVIFDKPAVIEVTREIIADHKMEDRVTTMEGDYGTDPLGSGYDLIYAKATLSMFRDDLNPLFKKIYDALNPGGFFVSVHDGLTNESTRPTDMVIGWLPTGLSSLDLSFDRDVIPDAMLEAGFKTVKIKPIPFSMGETMDMCIGKK